MMTSTFNRALVTDQEWFLERYHPENAKVMRETKIKWTESESAVFGEQLRANPGPFIASASLDPISEVCKFCLSAPSITQLVFSRSEEIAVCRNVLPDTSYFVHTFRRQLFSDRSKAGASRRFCAHDRLA